jgi:hypothetical protein
MMPRAAAALLVVAASTAVAHAQGAPGETAPAPAPAPAEHGWCSWSAGAHESVMANRWAVGLSLGQLSLAPKDSPDAKTDFGVGELSLRFRATPHLELELAGGGGRQTLNDGTQGQLEAHTGVFALRYRFAPEQRWNWWLMGGVGGISVVEHGAGDQAVQDSQRPLGELGVGVERRFRHFALQAELRGVGVGVAKASPPPPEAMPTPVSGGGANPASSPMSTTMSDKLSGGQLTIGASYYF